MTIKRGRRKKLWSRTGPFEFYRLDSRLSSTKYEYGKSDTIVRKLRGNRCRGLGGFMVEVGAALQFPYDFHCTWTSFEENLESLLEDLDGARLLVVVEHADEFLVEDPRQLPAFFSTVRTARSRMLPGGLNLPVDLVVLFEFEKGISSLSRYSVFQLSPF